MSNFRKIIFSVSLCIAFALSVPHYAEGAWYEDYDEALAAAKREGKYILADFTGSDWCGWCIKLNKEVFSRPEFIAWAQGNVVLLELDYPRKKAQSQKIKEKNQELLSKYGVSGYPTILFLDPQGNSVGTLGYMEGGPKPWVAQAQSVLDQQPVLRGKNKSGAEVKIDSPGVGANDTAPEVMPDPSATIYLKSGASLKGDITKQDGGMLVNQGNIKIFIKNENIEKVVPN